MLACSPLEARQLALAEDVLAMHGLVAVSPEIAAIIERWEAAPSSVTPSELAALQYIAAVYSRCTGDGGAESLQPQGIRTGWGAFCNRASPPFVPHQKGLS